MRRYTYGIIVFLWIVHLVSQESVGLQIGDVMPAFQANNDEGEMWQSENYIGKRILILYFYPAAMTSGCTIQACNYRDSKEDFNQYNADVIGVSGDSITGLQLFKEVHQINFMLLSDPIGSVAQLFGVPISKGGKINKEINAEHFMLSRGVTANRWTFVIGLDGKLLYKNENVDPSEDAKQV
ncbi:peroxiredoxin, partial [bacterium]